MERARVGLAATSAFAVTCALALASADAQAAPPWVDRRITPSGGQWNFDFGLGVGHTPDESAAGINLEMGVGLTDHLELGVRTGLRFGDDEGRGIEGDNYARLFDRQYFDGGNGVLANPEVRIRWAFLNGSVAEMGVEGRVIIPIESNTQAGLEPGLPLAFHLGNRVRLDTGVWLPIITGNEAVVGLSVPVDVWIQATPRLWLGPMTGLQAWDLNGHRDPQTSTYISLGFGIGYQITRTLDFKGMFLFPELSNDSRFFGLGAGIQIRIE